MKSPQIESSLRESQTFDVRPYDQVLSNDAAYLSRRLTFLALFLAGMISLIFPVKYLLISNGLAVDTEPSYAVFYRLAIIGASLLVVATVQLLTLSARGVKAVALAYKLVVAFLIASMEFLLIYERPTLGPGISQVCVWVILLPIFIHPGLWSNIISSAVSGFLVPAAYYALRYFFDYPEIPSKELVAYFAPTIMICFSSVIPTSILSRASRALKQARNIGSYKLQEKIGMGGMGEVWKARHQMLLRNVAIKIINTSQHTNLDSEGRENISKRFKLEAQAIAKLKSPHTIEIYDVGTCPKKISFYYVMEHLEGYDLRILVEKFGPISAGRAIYILKQVAHSLRNAHENALVHRDVKPANIVVSPYGSDFDFVKVLDFGLVKMLDDNKDNQLTQDGMSSGTPAFIAPEMAMGSKDVSMAADIYAFGCVAYWLVTGSLVFDAENAIQMAVKHVQEAPIPPSARSEIAIPQDFEAVIMKCLQKDPKDRYQSMVELHQVLSECDPHDWDQKKARKWWDLHQRVSTLDFSTNGGEFEEAV